MSLVDVEDSSPKKTPFYAVLTAHVAEVNTSIYLQYFYSIPQISLLYKLFDVNEQKFNGELEVNYLHTSV